MYFRINRYQIKMETVVYDIGKSRYFISPISIVIFYSLWGNQNTRLELIF